MKHIYWSPRCQAAQPPTQRTCSHPRIILDAILYNFLCLKLHGHYTESHQISTRCIEMVADYSAEIKIVIFSPFRYAKVTMKIIVKLRPNRGNNCAF